MLPSATNPPIVKLFDHTAGDTWVGIATIGPLGNDDQDTGVLVPMGADLVSAVIEFVAENGTEPVLVISTAEDAPVPLVIVNASGFWELSVAPVAPDDFPLAPGRYAGRLRTTDADGMVHTKHHYLLTVTSSFPDPC